MKTQLSKKKGHILCKLLGHNWKGNSLTRSCTRCNKVQTAKYSTNLWVDI
ncbi:MAG TPA: hypothetical protein DCS93_19415 [Microscillaceae bacterium]|nr:hypothetical protein [Microscillaceae bacterium]